MERKRRKSCEHASKNIDKINKRRIKIAIIFQCTAKPTTNSRSDRSGFLSVLRGVEVEGKYYYYSSWLLLSKSPCPPPSLILFLGSNPPDNLTERNEQKKNARNLCVSLEDNEVTCPWCLQKPSSPRSMRVVLAHLCARAAAWHSFHRTRPCQFLSPPLPFPLPPWLLAFQYRWWRLSVCRPTSASSH